jgi:hypothetical protein
MPGDYKGISRDLVFGLEKLRAKKGLSRFIYIRPSEQALRRSGPKGATRTPSRSLSTLRVLFFSESSTAG